jgi:hypothetical protein
MIPEIWRYCQKWKEHASKLTDLEGKGLWEGLAKEKWDP